MLLHIKNSGADEKFLPGPQTSSFGLNTNIENFFGSPLYFKNIHGVQWVIVEI